MQQGPKDSYEALAISIERVVRTDLAERTNVAGRADLAAPTVTADLTATLDRIMLDEARAGELRLAWVRLIVVLPYAFFAVLALFRPGAAAVMNALVPAAALGTAWIVGSVALVVALRRGWYRRWVPHVTPVVHAAIILLAVYLWWRRGETVLPVSRQEIVAYVLAHCAFLTLSGALRLSRWAARAGTTLGVIVFVVVGAVAGMSEPLIIAIALVLLATGLLASSVTALVRRVVTDQVARAALARMYEEAEETIDAREQVLKIVSHDLRNPLNTISMTASLLLDSPDLTEQQKNHLARIKRAGVRMNRLIQDLLDVAKLEAGRVAVDARQLEVAPLMREACEMLTPLAAEKSIALECTVADGLPPIMADSGRILQVISNLAGNAIKFTPAGGRIFLRADHDPRGVKFSIRDTGPGIPPDQLAHIFGRFWQANPADRRGIGLGLTIAKGIVEAHGGRIWCDSRPGEGATFQFTLGREIPPGSSGVHERRKTGSVGGEAKQGL